MTADILRRAAAKARDPLGLVTGDRKERCRFGRTHSLCMGFYVYADGRGEWSADWSRDAFEAVFAEEYLRCSECGQVEYDAPTLMLALAQAWESLADYLDRQDDRWPDHQVFVTDAVEAARTYLREASLDGSDASLNITEREDEK